MKKFVFVWTDGGGIPVLPFGTDKILMVVDGRWSLHTIHRRAREVIRERKDFYGKEGKTMVGYSVGCLASRGENWATCIMGFTPYTGDE